MLKQVIYPDIDFRYAKENKTNQADFFSHHHTQHELLFILRGQGTLFIENHSYSFSDKTVFLIPAGMYHVLQIPALLPYERYVVNFAPELLPPMLGGGSIVCKYADDELLALCARMRSYADRFPPDRLHLLLRSVLTEFLLVLFADTERGTLQKVDAPPLIQRAMDYINENLEKPLTVQEIADALFVSKSYLVHSFERVLNTGVMQYVRIKKMCEARRLLLGGCSPTQTAARLGYKNYSTFLRNYRAEFTEKPFSAFNSKEEKH